ncbi:hypothetical protein C8Q77DRAFT_1163629 [Trametes polyzona]|nr:hypothetical protein C8Q77DRAFT_1163629 [Trametes polyzona]
MSDFSDTESESDASAIGWDAADFVQMAMELGRIDAAQPETLDPSAALEALRNLDICAVEHDERLLAVVQRVSNNLLSFLDSVNASVPDHPCTNEPRSIHAHLLALLNESSMALLLQYRALFRAIASRNTSELSSAIPTATWLHHLDTPVIDMPSAHSVDWWDDQLVAALERDQFAALSMLSRVVMRHLSDSPALGVSDDIAMDVLLKACWGVKHILQSIHPDDSSLAWVLAKMYQLFFSLGGRELDLAVKDLIIEILSLSPGNLCLALASTSESRSEYANGWERSECCREDSFRDNPPALALHSIRQSLQLLTLLAAADCTPTGVVVEMIRRFFSGLLDWLRSEWRDYYIWDSLGGATLTALSMLAGTSLGDLVTGLGTDSVWDVVGDADLLNLPLAASVSAYYAAINNSSKAHDILACAEVWTYLQDVLLLVLNREFSGDEEPLALLVSPILCRTLSSILQHAPPGFERYIKTSPWTGCLLTLLHGVVKEPEGVDEYDRVLHELIGPLAADICRRLQKSPGTDTAEAERVKADLTFCWSGGRACLIPC